MNRLIPLDSQESPSNHGIEEIGATQKIESSNQTILNLQTSKDETTFNHLKQNSSEEVENESKKNEEVREEAKVRLVRDVGIQVKRKKGFRLSSVVEIVNKSEKVGFSKILKSQKPSKFSTVSAKSLDDEEKLDISGKSYKFHTSGMMYWQPSLEIENIVLVIYKYLIIYIEILFCNFIFLERQRFY